MADIDDILAMPTSAFDNGTAWHKLDDAIESIPTMQDRIHEWERVVSFAEAKGLPTGHPHFRLGVSQLMSDTDEATGLRHLELAHEEDKKWNPKGAHRMAAYRVLCLTKELLSELESKNDRDPQKEQLKAPHRFVLIGTILRLYDETRMHIVDMPILTYDPFFQLINSGEFRLFAGQNYYLAHDLLELAATRPSFHNQHEYALARTVISLYGGVLEAILADKLSTQRPMTLGGLISEAYKRNVLIPGTQLAALSTVMLHFRNHLHPDRARTQYFVDLNVAKGCKVAVDVAIHDLLASIPKAIKP